MAYTFSVNNSIGTHNTPAHAIWFIISTLMSAGWTKVMDSDGTTYSAAGTQVTGPNTGTNGLDNNRAWVRLQAPPVNGGAVVNQTREFTFQRATALSTEWRIKYSASALFTGGSPAATITPSAGDEVFMIGAGTDASPTFNTWLLDNTNPWRYHVVCGGAAEFYSFAAWGTGTTNSAIAVNATAIYMDVMAPGSFPSIDVDPAVVYASASSALNGGVSGAYANGWSTSTQTNPCVGRAWLGSTSAAGASLTSNNVNVSGITYNPFNSTNTLGTNTWTNKDDLFPIFYGAAHTAGARGYKGISTLFKAGTIQRGQMVTCDTISPGSKDMVFIDQFWAPWSGVPPLI